MNTSPNPDPIGGYYVVERGQKKGPLALSDLDAMRRDGTLAETTLLWIDGMENWEPANKVVPQVFFHAVPAPTATVHPEPKKITLTLAHPKWRFLGGVIDICILTLPSIFLTPIGGLIVALLYDSITMASQWQGTVGMKAFGLKVVDESGRKLSFGHSFGRAAASLISVLPFPPFCVGYYFLFFNQRHQTLHDLMAKTLVVRSKDQ